MPRKQLQPRSAKATNSGRTNSAPRKYASWGFVGCMTILGPYLLMLLWGLWIARSSRDGFGTMLAIGLVGTLFWPAAIKGFAPVIGVPLPLFSYGASAIVAAIISLSLLLNISMRRYVF